ncbi:MAG: ABC transporter permease, partial [bacterium]|nr:ABC transporter permease [bacterium]
MSKIWSLAVNDLRLTFRDRPAFVWLLVMPVAMMWLFGGMGGGAGSGPSISLSVANHDDGWLGAAIVDELRDESIVLDERTDLEEAPVRTLVIPEGFTRGVLGGEQQVLRLEKEEGTNEDFGLAAQVHIVRGVVRSLGRLVEMGDLATQDPAVLRARFTELGTRDPLVKLAASDAGQGRRVPQGRAQSVPGIMTFVVMMMTLIYGGVFLTVEKQSGMLRRQAATPLSRSQLFCGKFGGRLLLAAIQLAVLVSVGRFVFGISWGRSPAGLLLLLVCYAIAVASLSTLLGSVARDPGQASSIGWILGMILAALGGCWWPSEVMPRWLWSAAHLLPTAWAMDGFHSLISFGHGLAEVV